MAGWEVTSSQLLKPRQNFQQDLKNGTWNNQLSRACMSKECSNNILHATRNGPLATVAHSQYNEYLCSQYIAHMYCKAVSFLNLIPTLTHLAHHRPHQSHQVHRSLV